MVKRIIIISIRLKHLRQCGLYQEVKEFFARLLLSDFIEWLFKKENIWEPVLAIQYI